MENRNYLLYAWIGERGLHLGGISFLSQGGREGRGRTEWEGGIHVKGKGEVRVVKELGKWGNYGRDKEEEVYGRKARQDK